MFRRSAPFYGAIYSSFKDYEAETRAIDALIAERQRSAHTLLDVACGTGRHLAHWRERYGVEGLDINEEFLEIARSRLPGIHLHHGDMRDFDLGRRFVVVTCLFSASAAWHRSATSGGFAAMARHLEAEGLLVFEPWVAPDAFLLHHLGAVLVDEPHLKIARINTFHIDGKQSVVEMHYLAGTPEGNEHFTEEHALTLFTDDTGRRSVRAGLSHVERVDGPMGRGLYVGRRKGIPAGARR